MERYLCHIFYKHPSISAVLARNLADNYVKLDKSQHTKIKQLVSQVKALETTQRTLQANVDGFRSEKESTKEPSSEPKEKPKSKNGRGTPAPGSG